MSSAQFQMISPNNSHVTFTVEHESMSHIIKNLPQFENKLLEMGYTLVATPVATPQITPQATNQTEEVFTVTAIEYGGKTKNNEMFWRVKGGNFMKYGVMMYPEAIEASILPTLNPADPPNLAGWTAYYATNGNGKPKITRLTRS